MHDFHFMFEPNRNDAESEPTKVNKDMAPSHVVTGNDGSPRSTRISTHMGVMFDHVCDSYPGLDHKWDQMFIQNIRNPG